MPSDSPPSLPPTLAVVAGALAAAAACAGAPLLVYTLSLALFGLPHVLCELRYLDARFAPRLARPLWIWLGLGLGGVVLVRALGLLGALPKGPRAQLELALVLLLAAGAWPTLRARGGWRAALGVALVATLAAGVLLAPLATLLLLASLHNLTPVGFLADRLSGAQRTRALLLCALVFLAVPALLASGVPTEWFLARGALTLEAPWGWGPLESHLGVFLPATWQRAGSAVALFSAAVYLQVMHYGAVLHVLPRLGDPDDEPRARLPWPRRTPFLVGVALLSAALFLGFLTRFGDARVAYGIAAAVHAWIELPLLLLALAGPLDKTAAPVEDPVLLGGT